jgi:hypothetical protein
MMSLLRLSIRAMFFGVLLVAGNCAAWRLLLGYPPAALALGIFSVMPMSNILAVAVYRASTRRSLGQPFLIGFVLAGALAVLIWFHLSLMAEERQLTAMLNWYSKILVDNVRYYVTTNQKLYITICLIISVLLFASLSVLPQMLVAMSGGWIARRYAKTSDIT